MPIYVVGAGPGDPSLLTIRAVELLRSATIVALGDLVNEEIVRFYAPHAKVVRLGHRREEHDKAILELIRLAKDGESVVILKNGDPTIFGRAFSICEMAFANGVECEIVPGVTSFSAASALYGVPLTEGCTSHTVALVSFPFVNSETLSKVSADTLVVFMMGDKRGELIEALKRIGRPIKSLYVCYRVSYPDGGCVRVNLEELGKGTWPRPTLFIVKFGDSCS